MLVPAFLKADASRPASNPGARSGPIALAREMGAWLLVRIRMVRPERWWLILFACLLLAFGLALVFQPTVGRGGR